MKLPYPFVWQGSLHLQQQHDTETPENNVLPTTNKPMLTGSAELQYQHRLCQLRLVYRRNVSYFDGSQMEGIGCSLNSQVHRNMQIDIGYQYNHYQNWPVVGSANEHRLQCSALIAF